MVRNLDITVNLKFPTFVIGDSLKRFLRHSIEILYPGYLDYNLKLLHNHEAEPKLHMVYNTCVLQCVYCIRFKMYRCFYISIGN